MEKVEMVSRLLAMLGSVRSNVAKYRAAGDAKAVAAGEKMIASLEAKLSEVCDV